MKCEGDERDHIGQLTCMSNKLGRADRRLSQVVMCGAAAAAKVTTHWISILSIRNRLLRSSCDRNMLHGSQPCLVWVLT